MRNINTARIERLKTARRITEIQTAESYLRIQAEASQDDDSRAFLLKAIEAAENAWRVLDGQAPRFQTPGRDGRLITVTVPGREEE
jgi:hypothetical protein